MVIEAFPRSANSFGARMFRHANPQLSYEEVSHHSHIVSNVKQAVKWKIPVLVIVREPVDTITSNMMALGDTTDGMLEILTQKYIDFYEWILQNPDHIVIVRFETIIDGHFRYVSRLINDRFNTDFNDDFDEETLVHEVRAIIRDHSPHNSNPTRIALPSERREAAYGELRPRVRGHKSIEIATRLYERLLAEAVTPIPEDDGQLES
jgi:hypothetical protein